MRGIALVAMLSLGGVMAFTAEALPYDSAATKDIMHSNIAAAESVNKAVAAGDWEAVASGFLQFAQNAQKARQFAPPKGDAQEWARLWDDVLFAAYRGVGAAGEKDPGKVKAALDQILSGRNAGHSKFKG